MSAHHLREEIRCLRIMIQDHSEHAAKLWEIQQWDACNEVLRGRSELKKRLARYEEMLEEKTRDPKRNGTTATTEK